MGKRNLTLITSKEERAPSYELISIVVKKPCRDKGKPSHFLAQDFYSQVTVLLYCCVITAFYMGWKMEKAKLEIDKETEPVQTGAD